MFRQEQLHVPCFMTIDTTDHRIMLKTGEMSNMLNVLGNSSDPPNARNRGNVVKHVEHLVVWG